VRQALSCSLGFTRINTMRTEARMKSNHSPAPQGSSEPRDQTRISYTLILAALGTYLLVGCIGLSFRDWRLVISVGAASVLLALPVWLFRSRRFHAGNLVLMVIVLATVTTIATVGQGIRDVAILAYPIVFIYVGLTSNRAMLGLCGGLTFLALLWLALGESFGLFAPMPTSPGPLNLLSLALMAVLLLVAAVAVDLMASNTRKSLAQARFENAERQAAVEALGKSTDLFSEFVDHSPLYAFIKEVTPTESRVIKASENFKDMIGIESSEMVGKTMDELFPSELAAKMTADDWSVVASGRVLELDEAMNGRNYHTIKFPISRQGKTYLAGYTTDVTERKQMEKELQEHHLHLESIVAERTKKVELLSQLTFVSLESASVGAWWINFEEDDTYHALDTTATLIGVPLSSLPDKAYRISEWVNVLRATRTSAPEYAGMVDSALEQFAGTISGKYKEYRTVYPVVLPDQPVRWIDARADVSSRDKDGKALMMTGTLIDVTKLMDVEKELKGKKIHLERLVARRTEELEQRNLDLQVVSERLSLATRAANIGVWDWNVVKDNLVWDDAMYGLYGMRREDFGGAYAAWSSAIHPEDKARTEEAIQEALRGEREYAPEFRVVWPDGSIHHLQAASLTFRTPDGKPFRMVGINLDTTARKRAETALRESEERYAQVASQSRTYTWELDSLGMYTFVSPIAEDITGYRPDELVGKMHFYDLAPGEDRDAVRTAGPTIIKNS